MQVDNHRDLMVVVRALILSLYFRDSYHVLKVPPPAFGALQYTHHIVSVYPTEVLNSNDKYIKNYFTFAPLMSEVAKNACVLHVQYEPESLNM